jgi:hypothetical protein
VITSARRWLKKGVFQTTVINQLMILGYLLGISPQQLANWYRQGKHLHPVLHESENRYDG